MNIQGTEYSLSGYTIIGEDKSCGFYASYNIKKNSVKADKKTEILNRKKLSSFKNNLANFIFISEIKKFSHKEKFNNGSVYVYEKSKDRDFIISPEGLLIKINDSKIKDFFCFKEYSDFCFSSKRLNKNSIFFKEDIFLKSFIEKEYHSNFLIFIDYPTQKVVEKEKTNPMKFIRDKRIFFINLNCLIHLPPKTQSWFEFISSEDIENVRDYFRFPDFWEKIFIYGYSGKSVSVSSTAMNSIMDIGPKCPFSQLLLLAGEKYYSEKFGTLNEKKIVNSIFNFSRGKEFDESLIKKSGVHKNDNEDGIYLVSSGRVFGEKGVNHKIFNDRALNYAPDQSKQSIDMGDFNSLVNDVFPFFGWSSYLEGYSVIAFSILSLFARALTSRFAMFFGGDSFSGKSYLRRGFMKRLQSNFSCMISDVYPGTTFGAFKDTLRDGKILFYFEESEGNTYDEKVIETARSSTYEKTQIEQIRKTGGRLSTPVEFMYCSFFNKTPTGIDQADLNRIYYINFSSKDLKMKETIEMQKTLQEIDIESMGGSLFNSIFYNFQKYKENLQLCLLEDFHQIENQHLRIIISQIIAFYKTVDILGDREILSYKKFLSDKVIKEPDTFSSDLLSYLLRIRVRDEGNFRQYSISYILSSLRLDRMENLFFQEKIKLLKSNYRISLIKKRGDSDVCLFFPIRDNFIIKNLIQEGCHPSTAQSYSNILISFGGKIAVKSYGNIRTRGVEISMKHIVPEMYETYKKKFLIEV